MSKTFYGTCILETSSHVSFFGKPSLNCDSATVYVHPYDSGVLTIILTAISFLWCGGAIHTALNAFFEVTV